MSPEGASAPSGGFFFVSGFIHDWIDSLPIGVNSVQIEALASLGQVANFESDDKTTKTIHKLNQKIKEDTKNGIVREYTSNETNQIFETNLNNYRIVYDKTFVHSGKYHSYVVIEYILES